MQVRKHHHLVGSKLGQPFISRPSLSLEDPPYSRVTIEVGSIEVGSVVLLYSTYCVCVCGGGGGGGGGGGASLMMVINWQPVK